MLTGILFFLLSILSCNKPDLVTYNKEGNIYMPQAYGTQAIIPMLLLDTPQYIVFGADYGGLKYPAADISTGFIIDSAQVAVYNAQQGTAYTLLPASNYQISGFTSVLKAGQTSSVPLKVVVTTKNLGLTTPYILPITLKTVSGGKLDTTLRTAFFRWDRLDNIYAGHYHTTGTRKNYNPDGTYTGTSNIDDFRDLSTVDAKTCNISTIANLGVRAGTLFQAKVNTDNTVVFSGYLSAPGAPITNIPGTTSTYDPVNKVFTVHYMYTNTNGTYRYMDEVWTKQ